MSFKDHFSQRPAEYARHRPAYPDALFEWLAARAPGRRCAWDCATGNGQAAVALADRFDAVVATDASAAQLERAFAHPRVTYRVAPAEASGLDDASVDLLTVAQALHWFDLDAFWREALRVLRPGGLVAVWSYALHTITPAVDAATDRLTHDALGPYWPAENRLVFEGYAALPAPFAAEEAPTFAIEADWPLEAVLDYVRTWSAAQRGLAATGRDLVGEMAPRFAAAWGDAARRRVRWPLHLRVGRAPA